MPLVLVTLAVGLDAGRSRRRGPGGALRVATVSDDDETTEVPAPSNADVARWWAQQWAVDAALNPIELPDNLSGNGETHGSDDE